MNFEILPNIGNINNLISTRLIQLGFFRRTPPLLKDRGQQWQEQLHQIAQADKKIAQWVEDAKKSLHHWTQDLNVSISLRIAHNLYPTPHDEVELIIEGGNSEEIHPFEILISFFQTITGTPFNMNLPDGNNTGSISHVIKHRHRNTLHQ